MLCPVPQQPAQLLFKDAKAKHRRDATEHMKRVNFMRDAPWAEMVASLTSEELSQLFEKRWVARVKANRKISDADKPKTEKVHRKIATNHFQNDRYSQSINLCHC